MGESPNPFAAAWSMLRARRRAKPMAAGQATAAHGDLAPVLEMLRRDGIASLVTQRAALAAYRHRLETIDPDSLSPDHALAYWLNLYNAGALDLAARAAGEQAATVLRVPGGFSAHWADVAGEALTLDDIEHGKVRRFGDPRIHSALVCGSASCPTLRHEPYDGDRLSDQLDDQMRSFLASGAAIRTEDRVELSRVFKWYGGDFVRPHRMPTLIPASRRRVLEAIAPWLDPDLAAWVSTTHPRVEFQSYDWALACAIG